MAILIEMEPCPIIVMEKNSKSTHYSLKNHMPFCITMTSKYAIP